MNTQLGDIADIFLKDSITNEDIIKYLRRFDDSNGKISNTISALKEQSDLTNEERQHLKTILKNIKKEFRVQGKRSVGLENYIATLKI